MTSSSPSSSSAATTTNSIPTLLTMSSPISPPNLVALNANTQLRVQLSSSNYTLWRAQLDSLLIGYDLVGYVDGTLACPAAVLEVEGTTQPNPAYTTWIRQDKLILHALISSVSESLLTHIAACPTSAAAWSKLERLFASKSRSRIMNLKAQLSNIKAEGMSMESYLQKVEALADELSLVDSPVHIDDLIIYTLDGLPSDYDVLCTNVRNRDTPITFAELHAKILEHERHLQRKFTPAPPSIAVAHVAQRPSRPPSQSRYPHRGGFSTSSHRGGRRSPLPPPFSNNRRSPPTRPPPHFLTCQLCFGSGHSARQCQHFFPPRSS